MFTLLPSGAAAELPPRPSGPVADFAQVIDQDTRLKINSAARNLWVEQKVGLVVVTVDHTGGSALATYAEALFNEWGIGGHNGRSALLVVVCKEPADAYILFGTGDSALHAKTDGSRFAHLSGIADIRSGYFSDGLLVLTAELVRSGRGGFVAQQVSSPKKVPLSMSRRWWITLCGVGCLSLAVMVRRFKTLVGYKQASPLSGFSCSYTHGAFLSEVKS